MKRALVAISLVLAACGGKSTLPVPDDGGAGGGGGTALGGSGGTALGGSGGSAGCAPADTGAACDTLGEVGCLGAFPRCVPVYDDECCPSCQPTGMCADCSNWKFFRCVPRDKSSCTAGAGSFCGQTPSWACNGGTAECQNGGCQLQPGCVQAFATDCPPDAICQPECHPVTAESCGPACGPPVPMPLCPNGGVQEVQAGKYAGYCIDGSICAPPVLACPPPLPSGMPCENPGQVCEYGSWCKDTCTCTNGLWSCVTPPC